MLLFEKGDVDSIVSIVCRRGDKRRQEEGIQDFGHVSARSRCGKWRQIKEEGVGRSFISNIKRGLKPNRVRL